MENLEQLYLLYRGAVYRYLLSLCRDEHQAEELLAETFYQALHALPGYRGGAPVKTWLFGIAHNVWRHTLRRAGRERAWEERLAEELAENVEDRAAARQAAARALELLGQQAARSQEIVRMRLAGWPFAQIAEACGVSEASARVIDFRTRRALREALEKEGFYE